MSETYSFAALETHLRDALIGLLKKDPDVRQLVFAIAAAPADFADVGPVAQQAQAPVSVEASTPDSLREQLSAQLALLQAIGADDELRRSWLVVGETEGQQLARLLATAAQWERLLELWDLLAERCKAKERPASVAELAILEGCLNVHNLIWRDRKAQLCSVEVGAEYDYRVHQRTTLRGEVITAQWLPGLANAGGERQRLPLAAAE